MNQTESDTGRAEFEKKWKKIIEDDVRQYLNNLRDAAYTRRNVK